MYLSAAQIAHSIAELIKVHPFHGITFLVCKKAGLPIGKSIELPMDTETFSFMQENHRLDPGSEWLFTPFKSNEADKRWVRKNYPSTGLQSINTQTFGTAFIHEPNTRRWGWHADYISVLKSRLVKKRKIPVFDLAVWLYRDREWPDPIDPTHIVGVFFSEFKITTKEKSELFDEQLNPLKITALGQSTKPSWLELREHLPPPPDAKPDQGGTLAYLKTIGLGPAAELVLEPADRLSLITGDNGLGKSFLLDTAWWALTGTWAERPAYPSAGKKAKSAEIAFAIAGESSKAQKRRIAFDWKSLSWPLQTKSRPTIPGLIVYARVDGSFAVWDPARQNTASPLEKRKIVFSSADVWDGLQGRIEGLIRDWIRWQNSPTNYPFEVFAAVLKRLSPPDLGEMKPGRPTRIPDDPRDIPTLVHPYGETPIIFESAGVRRIITLAYLIVWAWHEHVVASRMMQSQPQRRMVVLIDEIEAHLHPKWQRALLPALMDVSRLLTKSLKVQYLVATHSPLVMASSESVFDPVTDKLFHLDISESGDVGIKELEYARFGDVSSWLTSPVFELRHARSNEGEAAIEAAKALQLRTDAAEAEVADATKRLQLSLSSDDRFWPRWIVFAERYGVRI